MEMLLPPEFVRKFPETIEVGQSVATWKAVVFYQAKHEQAIKE